MDDGGAELAEAERDVQQDTGGQQDKEENNSQHFFFCMGRRFSAMRSTTLRTNKIDIPLLQMLLQLPQRPRDPPRIHAQDALEVAAWYLQEPEPLHLR